jgi:quercetin dioxygenase-like cupin family protein
MIRSLAHSCRQYTFQRTRKEKVVTPSDAVKSGSSLQYVRLKDLPVEEVNPLLDRQIVSGERSMLARIILRKGCIVPMHSHDNEQISYILEGALRFSIEGREIVVSAGEVLVIPSQVPHSAEALEDTVDLDLFCPPRADWLNKTDAYLRR